MFIEDLKDADSVRDKLTDALVATVKHLQAALMEHDRLAHWEASVETEKAIAALRPVTELEEALIDWQDRPAAEYDDDEDVTTDAVHAR